MGAVLPNAVAPGASVRQARERILIQLPNWVGDAVMAAPAIRALHAARPAAWFILCGNSRSAPLFARFPFHAILRFESKGLGAMLGLTVRVRRLGIQEALILGPSARAAMPAFLSGVGRRVGMGGEGRRLLLTRTTPRSTRRRHLALDYLEAAAQLGADPAAPLDPRLPIGDDEIASARSLLDAREIGSGWVAFAPGATYGETKRWPEERWIALGRTLTASGRGILLMGGEAERAICGRIAEGIGVRAASLAGQTGIREALAILACAAAAVSNDSGLMHLATAAGCPIVGIFGSTDPAWTGPLGDGARVVRSGLPCSPCYASVCPTEIECLKEITPEAVERELAGLLDGGEAG